MIWRWHTRLPCVVDALMLLPTVDVSVLLSVNLVQCNQLLGQFGLVGGDVGGQCAGRQIETARRRGVDHRLLGIAKLLVGILRAVGDRVERIL